MSLQETLEYRRSVRYFDEQEIDTDKVRRCIELAALAHQNIQYQLGSFITLPTLDLEKNISCLPGQKQLKLLNKSWSS